MRISTAANVIAVTGLAVVVLVGAVAHAEPIRPPSGPVRPPPGAPGRTTPSAPAAPTAPARTLPGGATKFGGQIGPSLTAPPLGWPHDSRASVDTPCHAAGANEVVLTLVNGTCRSLVPGFYVTNTSVGNTWVITNINVGNAVRARTFIEEHFSQRMGPFTMYAANANLPLSEAPAIRSMRVEPNNRSMICDDPQAGEIALFEGWDGAGDCVVLPDGQYTNADAMGIANDSISGVNNQTGKKAVLFWDAGFVKQGAVISPYTRLARLPQGGHVSDTIDNQTSSMMLQAP